jgi:hypothetical protein
MPGFVTMTAAEVGTLLTNMSRDVKAGKVVSYGLEIRPAVEGVNTFTGTFRVRSVLRNPQGQITTVGAPFEPVPEKIL